MIKNRDKNLTNVKGGEGARQSRGTDELRAGTGAGRGEEF